MSEREGAVDEHSFIVDVARGTVFDTRQNKNVHRGVPGFTEYLETVRIAHCLIVFGTPFS